MEESKLLIFFLGFILFSGLASAITTVEIKTLPYQDLYITPIKISEGFEALQETQFFSSDEYGNLIVDFEDFSVDKFRVFVSLKDSSGNTFYTETSSEVFLTGTKVNFTAAPDDSELIYEPEEGNMGEEEISSGEEILESLNEIANETNITNSSSNSSIISGGVVDKKEESKFSMQKLIFILAGFVLLIILYLVIREESKEGAFKDFGSKFKLSMKDKKKHALGENLEKTKQELREAKQRVESLKKKEQIEEVRVRLKKDEEALERLEKQEEEKLNKKK